MADTLHIMTPFEACEDVRKIEYKILLCNKRNILKGLTAAYAMHLVWLCVVMLTVV